ncbi:alpha-L-fucosidase [Sphingomonas morindae]|uniref:alpha-L-fucosidase n=1 Tax=Sphingomonas morindae TaxID=1541170 RepID=A0ABY4X777_9SPHN|nr:alpha-L-fucosidase [Sphingomonas morindae]USI72744.1 alpha-L-fucosidase [Sphingomonas morindae]
MTAISRRHLIGASLAAGAMPGFARAGADSAPPRPWGATPSPRQRIWHRRQAYAFVHFSINTFTGREWGYGDESPALFNPTDFDPDQIVGAAKAAGLSGIILTAKHHDGFCLWPTRLTEHCIRNSPYKNGRGDVVREMEQATRRAGLAFGLYLSPWDRNHPDYGRPGYIDYYRRQIVELCTGYGELFEFWFDGANGGDGYYGGARETRKIDAPAYYNWPALIALVHQHQPMACTFDPLGSDIRWVGNEDGVAGDPCWPTMPDHPYVQAEGNSGVRGAPLWWPAETDVSIRPGWFYHKDEDARVKTPEQLLGLWDTSVGRGTNLNLNLPPDRRGRLADHDVAVLRSFGAAQAATYGHDLARGAHAAASVERAPRFAAAAVLDGRDDSYWSTPDTVTTPSLTLTLADPAAPFDLIRLREYLPLGARVTRFAVEAEQAGGWTRLAEHQGIGAQRIIRLPRPITARRVRLRILEAPACPAIQEVALFRQARPAAVPFAATADTGIIDRKGWRIVSASSPGAEALIDGDPASSWSAPAPTAAAPARVVLDLGEEHRLEGFSLTPPRTGAPGTAPPRDYRCATSLDGTIWTEAGAGEFSNIAYARATQRFGFSSPRRARFVRLVFTAPAVPADRLTVAEIGFFTDPAAR